MAQQSQASSRDNEVLKGIRKRPNRLGGISTLIFSTQDIRFGFEVRRVRGGVSLTFDLSFHFWHFLRLAELGNRGVISAAVFPASIEVSPQLTSVTTSLFVFHAVEGIGGRVNHRQ